ncbi:MAG: hypothetical protein IKQ23_01190 [Treponema sp.]|nr:hypothetical protein [Treponema sp.]MBR7081014.1 hypothetical protein [Treponema sp.]
MTQIKDLYKVYGDSTRALDYGTKEYKMPSKVSRKVEILTGVMMSSASKGVQIPLSKFFGRVASRWNGKGTFTTADMFSPTDLSQALRLFYAKVSTGELSFKDGLLMAEVIENKSTRQLVLVFREFVPNLIQIVPADPVAPKTSKQADKTLSAILEKADLPEPVPVKTTVPEIALEPKIGEPVELSDAEKAMLQLQTMFMQSADVEVSNILGEAMEKLQALVIAKANVA